MISAESLAEDANGLRSRSYPWGVVDVDNTDYCDLHYLEKLLVKYKNPPNIVPLNIIF